MSHPIQKLPHVHTINVSLTAWHLDSIFIESFEDLFGWNQESLTVFGVVGSGLSEIKSVFVFEDFEVLAFYEVFDFELFLDGLVPF